MLLAVRGVVGSSASRTDVWVPPPARRERREGVRRGGVGPAGAAVPTSCVRAASSRSRSAAMPRGFGLCRQGLRL